VLAAFEFRHPRRIIAPNGAYVFPRMRVCLKSGHYLDRQYRRNFFFSPYAEPLRLPSTDCIPSPGPQHQGLWPHVIPAGNSPPVCGGRSEGAFPACRHYPNRTFRKGPKRHQDTRSSETRFVILTTWVMHASILLLPLTSPLKFSPDDDRIDHLTIGEIFGECVYQQRFDFSCGGCESCLRIPDRIAEPCKSSRALPPPMLVQPACQQVCGRSA